MANVYTIKVIYDGCEGRIWRELQISSNALLSHLGYTVLATFDTMAYRLVFLCAVLYGRIKRSMDMDCYETRRHPSACRLLGAKGSIYAGESRVTRRVSRM